MTTSGYSLGTFELGNVNEEDPDIEAQLFTQPMPGSNSASEIILDLFGVEKTIKINGDFIDGTGGKSIKQFCDQFVNAINGNQPSSGYAYQSLMVTSSIQVYLQSFLPKYASGDPTRVSYTLTLLEGKSS